MFTYTKTVPDIAPEAERIVVVPDVHRDLAKAQRALVAARVVDKSGRWIGGRTVVVQVGDQVDGQDRSGRKGAKAHVCHRALREDVAVIKYFNELHERATGSGGAVYSLVGNHELMNVHGMFQYAETDGCPECTRMRAKAFERGGMVARILATTRAVYLRVGRVGFVHAGILPWHIQATSGDPASLNAMLTDYLLGSPMPKTEMDLFDRVCVQPDGVLTSRAFTPDRHISKTETRQILASLGVDHLVIGHNASPAGIVALHGGMVIVCDPGMSSSVLDAPPQVLEIIRDHSRRSRSFRVIAEQSGRTSKAPR